MEASEAMGLRGYVISNIHMGVSNSGKLTNGNGEDFLIVLSRCMISLFTIVSIIMGQS